MKFISIICIIIISNLALSLKSMKDSEMSSRRSNLTEAETHLNEVRRFLFNLNEIDVGKFQKFMPDPTAIREINKNPDSEIVYENFSQAKLDKLTKDINSKTSRYYFDIMNFYYVNKDINKMFEMVKILGLTTLNLVAITHDDLEKMLNNPLMLSITKLNIGNNNYLNNLNKILNQEQDNDFIYEIDDTVKNLGDSEAIMIAKCANLKNLKYLDLNTADIGDVGAKAIAESDYLKNLTFLSLEFNDKITKEGKDKISTAKFFKNLEENIFGFPTDAEIKRNPEKNHIGPPSLVPKPLELKKI